MRGPNMSYCMIENTVAAMRQVLNAMEEADSLEDLDLNSYEKLAYGDLKGLCDEIVFQMERLEDSDSGDEEDEEEDEN